MRMGAWAPMQIWSDLSYADVAKLGDFAEGVEQAGLAGLWTYDHLVRGAGMYEVGWLEPITVLAHAAARTSTIDLGTSVLVIPTRHPVVLAKEIATLQFLSAGRFILGIGAGWNPLEFSAIGADVKQRGGRTDEMLEIVPRLLAGEELTHHGRYYHLDGIQIEPPVPHPQPIWYGGGSKPAPAGGQPTEMAPSVLRRIVHSDGWISRGAAPLELIVDDWRTITSAAQEAGRRPPVFSHCNYLHLVDSTDRDEVVAEQLRAYRRILGPDATEERIARTHFFGTIGEIQEQIQRFKSAGLEYLILGVLDYLPEQLTLWERHVLPLADPVG